MTAILAINLSGVPALSKCSFCLQAGSLCGVRSGQTLTLVGDSLFLIGGRPGPGSNEPYHGSTIPVLACTVDFPAELSSIASASSSNGSSDSNADKADSKAGATSGTRAIGPLKPALSVWKKPKSSGDPPGVRWGHSITRISDKLCAFCLFHLSACRVL